MCTVTSGLEENAESSNQLKTLPTFLLHIFLSRLLWSFQLLCDFLLDVTLLHRVVYEVWFTYGIIVLEYS